MNDLRIILLLLGIGVIAGVYAWTRFKQRGPRAAVRRSAGTRRAPLDEPDVGEIEQELARMEQLLAEDEFGGTADQAPSGAAPRSAAGSAVAERVVVVSVVAEAGAAFTGLAVAKALDHNRLKFGQHDIYHRMVFKDNREQPVFGVANLVKPGTFPVSDMQHFTTPGLTLFLQLPGPIDDVEAFDDFVHTAERLAVELGGELRDEQHQLLSHQVLMQMRDAIAGEQPRPVSKSF